MKSNVRQAFGGDQVENMLTSDHESRESQMSCRLFRLLHEIANGASFVQGHYAATPRVWHFVDSKAGEVIGVAFQNILQGSQVCSGQHVGIENPKRRIGTQPVAVCQKRSGAAKQSLFFGHCNLEIIVAVFPEEGTNSVRMSVHI